MALNAKTAAPTRATGRQAVAVPAATSAVAAARSSMVVPALQAAPVVQGAFKVRDCAWIPRQSVAASGLHG